MTLNTITTVVDGVLYNGNGFENTEAEGVVTDNRQIKKNYIFIAIKGERVDGHDLIPGIYEKGALAAISEKYLENNKGPYIKVSSSKEALKKLAAYYRGIMKAKIVGITGSVGKTSTKEYIASVLSTQYNVHKTEGNFNNEIGLPLTILKMKKEHEIAVIEMGISHFGDMKPLGEIARPDICVITNIGCCHLENLIDRDGVLKEKTDMFNYAGEDAAFVLNKDDDKLFSIKEVNGKKPVFVSIDSQSDVYAQSYTNNGISGSTVDIHLSDRDVTIKDVSVNIPGKHMVSNALIATAVGNILNISPENIKKGIETVRPDFGRLNIISSNGYTIIDDCYNANPVSMISSIDILNCAEGRKVAILGDMFELGKDEALLHGNVGTHIAKTDIDVLITIGRLSENINTFSIKAGYKNESHHFLSIDEFNKSKDSILQQGDTILVKASHGMEFKNVINSLTNTDSRV